MAFWEDDIPTIACYPNDRDFILGLGNILGKSEEDTVNLMVQEMISVLERYIKEKEDMKCTS